MCRREPWPGGWRQQSVGVCLLHFEPISWQNRIGRYCGAERLTSDSQRWVTNRPRDGSIDETPGVIFPNRPAGFFFCIETLSTFRPDPRLALRTMRERGTTWPAKG